MKKLLATLLLLMGTAQANEYYEWPLEDKRAYCRVVFDKHGGLAYWQCIETSCDSRMWESEDGK